MAGGAKITSMCNGHFIKIQIRFLLKYNNFIFYCFMFLKKFYLELKSIIYVFALIFGIYLNPLVAKVLNKMIASC